MLSGTGSGSITEPPLPPAPLVVLEVSPSPERHATVVKSAASSVSKQDNRIKIRHLTRWQENRYVRLPKSVDCT
jgi:hypothetical protein